MKRKRFDRDVWDFGECPYDQVRVDMDAFHGLACLLQLRNGNIHYWDRPKAGKVAICGAGMTWLQLIPDGREHTLTVMLLPDDRMSICYVDMIEGIDFDPDGVAVMIDKYLDVDFTPQGDVSIYDRDELDEAYASGELSDAQYNAALAECDRVIEAYCADIPRTTAVFDRILAVVRERIREGRIQTGEKPFRTKA